ncbi:MAG: hypothetical protein MUO92_02240 [Dehalococcoidales bacterium]|nr:hypothetical protein [Dehalococcoidales bacterium]
MKKILWALSVVLVMLIATGASADIRSDKCNTYSNDLGISSVLDNYFAGMPTKKQTGRQEEGANGKGKMTTLRTEGC